MTDRLDQLAAQIAELKAEWAKLNRVAELRAELDKLETKKKGK